LDFALSTVLTVDVTMCTGNNSEGTDDLCDLVTLKMSVSSSDVGKVIGKE